jgi:hypothetical protein
MGWPPSLGLTFFYYLVISTADVTGVTWKVNHGTVLYADDHPNKQCSVAIESQPGQGSTFAFTLPMIVERQVEAA